MGYYTRVFCKSNRKPTVKKILEQLNSNNFSAISNLDENELESENWSYFELQYKEGKLPILVELNAIGDPEGIAEEEIEEFKSAIGKPMFFSLGKKKVLKQLDQTNFILCNQLPISDIDEDGHDINDQLMEMFVNECEGMIQCDAEGFYLGNKLIVKQ